MSRVTQEKEWTQDDEQDLRRLFVCYDGEPVAELTDEEKASILEFKRLVETRKGPPDIYQIRSKTDAFSNHRDF